MPADRAEIEAVLRAATPSDPEAMARLLELRDSDESLAVVAELVPLLGEESRWAAVSVYAASGPDAGILQPLVADADRGIAAYAAAGLARRGEIAGVKGLVSALAAEGNLPGTLPPLPVWLFGAYELVSLTQRSDLGPPFDAEAADVLTAARRWRDWLDEKEEELKFVDGAWRT